MPTPERDHLRRLRDVWVENPIYFLTVCTAQRRKILVTPSASQILCESWQSARQVHGWVVGRYVIMPDHVHFFASPLPTAKPLSSFMRDWKKWTGRNIRAPVKSSVAVWQDEFFDHVLRSAASYSEKWDYVRANPVRAGLVAAPEEWPHSGECERLQF